MINSDAAPELRKFAKRFHIPVVTTLMGIGAVDTTSDLSLRMLGMHGTAFANYAVEDCDFLFAVGSRFDDRVAGKVKEFAPQATIAHLDVDASEIGKVKNVDWAHVSDAKRGLHAAAEGRRRASASRATSPSGTATSASCAPATRSTTTASRTRIQAEYVLEQLNEITRGNAIVTHRRRPAPDVGGAVHRLHPARAPSSPRAAWARWASACRRRSARSSPIPGALVIDVDGDGSIRMNLGELETLTTYDIPVKVLLLNNLGDGMVRQWQDLFYANRYSGSDKTLHKKDFVKAVRGRRLRLRAPRRPSRPRCAPTLRGVRRLSRPGVPRGHGRPDRARLPDGRPRHGLQGHDHRQVDPRPRAGRREKKTEEPAEYF